jgi:hypothetical protein
MTDSRYQTSLCIHFPVLRPHPSRVPPKRRENFPSVDLLRESRFCFASEIRRRVPHVVLSVHHQQELEARTDKSCCEYCHCLDSASFAQHMPCFFLYSTVVCTRIAWRTALIADDCSFFIPCIRNQSFEGEKGGSAVDGTGKKKARSPTFLVAPPYRAKSSPMPPQRSNRTLYAPPNKNGNWKLDDDSDVALFKDTWMHPSWQPYPRSD